MNDSMDVRQWRDVRDANGKLLFELCLVSGRVRIKARELTTEIDLERVRADALRALLNERR